ncbi:MAG: Flp pilus assembly protein CpaB [Actinomycetota bacterium]
MTTLVLNRRRSSRWSLLAVASAALVGLAVYSYLSWLRAQVPIAGSMVPVVVAARDIDSGVLIEKSMLALADHPENYLPKGSLKDSGVLVGKVLSVPVLEGDPITDRKVGRSGGASSVVPPGMRAYSLSASSVSGLAIMPQSGDRVDILVTFAGDGGQAVTETILRSAKVATLSREDSGSGGVAGTLGVEQGRRGGVTLLVTPEQAEALAQAESLGKIAIVVAPNLVESPA